MDRVANETLCQMVILLVTLHLHLRWKEIWENLGTKRMRPLSNYPGTMLVWTGKRPYSVIMVMITTAL